MINLSPSGDLVEAAANLFAALRTLDASGAAAIAVMPIPDARPGRGHQRPPASRSESTNEPETAKRPSAPTWSPASPTSSGPQHALTDPDQQLPYLREMRDLYDGRVVAGAAAGLHARRSPKSWRWHTEHGIPVVPQAGNTGLVGGQMPMHGEIVLSVARLKRVRAVDAAGFTMTVEAGLTLAEVHAAADEVNRLFPLSLPSEGSCRIGGNLGTNAGGVGVLAYGNARQLVLGLEVVLADGRIWNGLERAEEGQHRLRPERPVHRLGRHARRHHRRRAEAVPQAGRDGHGLRRAATQSTPRCRCSAWRRRLPARASPPSRSCRASRSTWC